MSGFSFTQPPEDALDYFKAKGQDLTFHYDEMMHDAHHRTFTVAKITRLDLLADVQQSLTDAMENGIPYEQWEMELRPTLVEKGWYGTTEVTDETTGEVAEIYVGARRLKHIYLTNMRVSYNVGRYRQFEEMSDAGYWRYVSALKETTRASHRVLHGIVREKGDPFWQKNLPPNDHGCICKVQAYNQDQLEAKGWKVSGPDTPLPIGYKGPHPDWAYDLRHGGAAAQLETEYFKKAKKLLATDTELARTAFETALSDLKKDYRKENFTGWLASVDKDIKHPQNEAIAGYISTDVYDYLVKQKITAEEPHIWLNKHGLTHILRQTKQDAEIALTPEEIRMFPDIITGSESVLYDKEKKNILYTFDNGGDKDTKIAVEVNYKTDKGTRNVIVSGGKVVASEFENKGRYERIK